jgi:hypothetical protein
MMPRDQRKTMISVFVASAARQIVRDDLRRRNCKPSHYAQAEIYLMARQYLQAGHWAELEAQALAKIMGDAKLRLEYEKAGLRYEAQMARRKPAAAFI